MKKKLPEIVVLTAILATWIPALVMASKPSVPTRPARGTAALVFYYNPPIESVKFRHPPFTTISCATRSGLTMEEPPTSGTVTGFSTAPFARIALCVSDQPMVEVP